MMKTTIKWVIANLAAVTVGMLSACTGTTTQNTVSSMPDAVSVVSSTASDHTDVSESIGSKEPVAESQQEQSTASDTSVIESRSSEETSDGIQGNHPSYLVGQWALKLDTSGLEEDVQSEASERMANTTMILYANGKAAGITYDSRIDGEWGELDGYVYVTLGTATEYFYYYVDTLESMNYAGMRFTR